MIILAILKSRSQPAFESLNISQKIFLFVCFFVYLFVLGAEGFSIVARQGENGPVDLFLKVPFPEGKKK